MESRRSIKLQRFASVLLASLLASAPAGAKTYRWSGAGGTDSWHNPFNWQGLGEAPGFTDPPSSVLFKAVATRTQVNLTSGAGVSGLLFEPDDVLSIHQAFTIFNADGPVTHISPRLHVGSSGIVNHTNKTQTINVPVQMQGAQIWGHMAGGGLAFNAPRYGSDKLHLIGAQGGHFFFSGDGEGHSGDITLLTGILWLGHANAISRTSMLKLQGNGSDSTHVILLTNTEMGGLSGLNSSVNIGPWQLTVGGNDRDADFGGTLVGAGSLVKTGAGLLTLSGDNEAYAGNVEVNGGKLRLINHKALSNTTRLTLASGVTLEVGAAEDIGALAGAGDVLLEAALGVGFNHQSTDFAGVMSGTGTFTKAGNGRMNLLGRNDFSGAVHVSGGVLGLGAANALGEGNVVTVDGAATLLVYAGEQRLGGLAGSGAVRLEGFDLSVGANGDDGTFAGRVNAKLGHLHKVGTGALTLTGVSDFGGRVYVDAGTLDLGAGDNLRDGDAVHIQAGAKLRLSAAREQLGTVSGDGDVELAADLATGYDHLDGELTGRISGVGSLEKGGRGVWKLSGVSAHAGDVVINDGGLRLVGRGALAARSGLIGAAPGARAGAAVSVENQAHWRLAEDLTLGSRARLSVYDRGEIEIGDELLIGRNALVEVAGGRLSASRIRLAGGTFDFTAGSLATGLFIGDLYNNGGTLAPGASPGLTEINGDYTQGANAALDIELARAAHDTVRVSGVAHLGGRLVVSLLDGVAPAIGSSFDFLFAAGGIEGRFDEVLLPGFGDRQLLLQDLGTHLRLQVTAVPLPPAAGLLGAGLVLLCGRWRRPGRAQRQAAVAGSHRPIQFKN